MISWESGVRGEARMRGQGLRKSRSDGSDAERYYCGLDRFNLLMRPCETQSKT
jgi:hypothetical protein